MAVVDINKIKSVKELEQIAKRHLEGKCLKEVMAEIAEHDSLDRVLSKASVGYVVEEGLFGIKRNNTAGADIAHLDVEIKTSPLTMGKDGKLRVKEPLSLNIINYNEEHKNTNLSESSLYKKNKKILFVWYIHDKEALRSDYLIKYVFVWEMNGEVLKELNPDYQLILEKIRLGQAHHIHQSDHKKLTLCPKHGGTFKNPDDRKSKTTQPFSDSPAEIRAFRLKNSYMNEVIRRYLRVNQPTSLNEFVESKES